MKKTVKTEKSAKTAAKTAAKVKKTVKAVVKAAKAVEAVKAIVAKSTIVSIEMPSIDPHDSTIKGANLAVAQASLLKIVTQSDAIEAGRALVNLKGVLAAVEAKRSSFVKPLNDTVKRINAMFKPTIMKLEAADTVIRTKVMGYRVEAEALAAHARGQLMEKAEEAQAAGDNETALAHAVEASEVTTMAKTTILEEGSFQMKKSWTFEVTDFGSVPHEYFTLDEKKIRAAVRSGVRDIAGVRIFEEDTMAVSAPAAFLAEQPADLSPDAMF